jgi:hypothetical protein
MKKMGLVLFATITCSLGLTAWTTKNIGGDGRYEIFPASGSFPKKTGKIPGGIKLRIHGGARNEEFRAPIGGDTVAPSLLKKGDLKDLIKEELKFKASSYRDTKGKFYINKQALEFDFKSFISKNSDW